MPHPHSAPTRTLPNKQNLAQLRKQAKDLLKSYQGGEDASVTEVERFERSPDPASFALADAQRVLARAYGFASWAKLKTDVVGIDLKTFCEAAEAGDVAAVLKDEITRLARKEIAPQVRTLPPTVAEQRRTIAELKRQVATLERNQVFLQKQEKRRLSKAPQADAAEGVRFSPKWVKADRKRLGLSAKDYGLLVGVSALTIYNWESRKSKPRAKGLSGWA